MPRYDFGRLEPDLYFEALVNHSTVPVDPRWRAWLHNRAREEKEIETLTAHRIQGIKVCLNHAALAQDISKALKKGGLKRSLEPNQLSLDCGKIGP